MSMQRLHLIKLAAMMLLSFNLLAASDCREVSVKSAVAKDETLQLCFLADDSYFISKNCQSLDCEMIRKLKTTDVPHSFKDRPGAVACKIIGGGVDIVSIDGKGEVQRCVFPKEHTSISLNLLESWNGKSFSGPAPKMEF